jgi:hypothetical protein
MDAARVPNDARPETLKRIAALKVRYPNETPARLFDRARKEGAPIPAPSCPHGVPRGNCVACEGRIGARYYFTAAGDEEHTTPTCPALTSAAAAIEVAATPTGRDQCSRCAKATAVRRARTTPVSRARPVQAAVRRLGVPAVGPAELVSTDPPTVGDRIIWGGYQGVVTDVTDSGVRLSVDGITLTAPWGERATIRKQSA